jgi:hypothetical protein
MRSTGYDDLQALFLMRLVRLMKLRTAARRGLSAENQRRTLIEAAFRSTMDDCVRLGVEAEAHALLESD